MLLKIMECEMYKNVVVLNETEHKEKGAKSLSSFAYAKKFNSCIIVTDEFYEACKSYPILFAKNSDGWYALALFGLDGKNNFVNRKGDWRKGCYIPAYVRRYPFIYVKDDKNLFLGIDSAQIIEKSEADERYFFEEDGSHSAFIEKIIKYLDAFHLQSLATTDFIKRLDNLGVLEESMITKTNNDKEDTYGNFWTVNESKLNGLSDDEKISLCKDNSMKLVTAHLISLSNVKRMPL